MPITYQLVENVPTVYQSEGQFDKALTDLRTISDITSTRDLFLARRIFGKGHPVSTNGAYQAEDFINLPKAPNIILIVDRRYSPILKDPKGATDAHRKGREYAISSDEALSLMGIAKEDPEEAIKTGVLLLPRTKVLSEIPVDEFTKYPVTRFLGRDQSEQYAKFLKESGIESVPFFVDSEGYVTGQKQPYANKLWVHWLDYWSVLDGYGRILIDCRVFGVSNLPAKQVANEISQERLEEKVSNPST